MGYSGAQVVDSNTGSTQAFCVFVASVAFAIFSASRGIETLRAFRGREEDLRHLHAINLLAGLTAIVSVLPLAISEVAHSIQICSYVSFAGGIATFSHSIYEIATRKVTLIFKQLSYGLIVVSSIAIGILGINAILFDSIVIYKVVVLWAAAVLCIRFYLVIGVVIVKGSDAK